jgi:hypothetical protein
MADIAGLFTTPDQYQLAQQQAQQAQALGYAQLDPRAQAQYGFYRGGQQLGNAIGGALGGVDPQLKLISQRQQLASQLDQSNPESFMKVAQLAAQSGDPQFAMAIADAGRQMQVGMATARKTTAEAQKAELTLTQEQNLRDELSKLPPDATEQQILSVVTKYGSPDKVLAALQRSGDMRNQIEAKKDIALQQIEAKKELALERAKTDAERAQIAADARTQAAQISADARKEVAQLVGSLKQPPAPSVTTIVDPTNANQMISIDTRQYKGGGVGSLGVIGISGKEPTAALRENKAEAGKNELQDQLDVLRGAFNTLNEKRAIPSTERNSVSNVLSYIQGTGVGQVAGRMGGTKEQVERDVINSAKQRLVQAIKTATGMSSQQLNSNFELKTMLNSLSDVNLGYEASMRIIDDLENTYVKGSGIGKSGMSAEDKQALQWANSNPNDPRSTQIKQRLGVK